MKRLLPWEDVKIVTAPLLPQDTIVIALVTIRRRGDEECLIAAKTHTRLHLAFVKAFLDLVQNVIDLVGD